MQSMVVFITTQEATQRAIARYGSTASISKVTNSGQRTTVDDRRLEGLGILDVWGIYSINN